MLFGLDRVSIIWCGRHWELIGELGIACNYL